MGMATLNGVFHSPFCRNRRYARSIAANHFGSLGAIKRCLTLDPPRYHLLLFSRAQLLRMCRLLGDGDGWVSIHGRRGAIWPYCNTAGKHVPHQQGRLVSAPKGQDEEHPLTYID
jgi:hypothetical protein